MQSLSPEQVAKQFGVTLEVAKAAIERAGLIEATFKDLPPESKEAAELLARCQLASKPTVQGFENFYWCFRRQELPPYAKTEWIPELYGAWKNHTGVLLDGFRGSTKSTILMLWILWVSGLNPVGSSVLARINDDAAAETGAAMAAIIEFHPVWKKIFPVVVPDKQRGWSSKGYHLQKTDVDYGMWVGMCVNDHLGEPSILCASITSGDIIGKHPSNGWYSDDLHNEKNSLSTREMSKLVSIFESDIIPTWNRPDGHPTLAVACTLWSENDVYHAMLKTGLFKHVVTPIFRLDESGEVYEGITHNGKRVKAAWPEKYSVDKIAKIENENPVQFPRMYLCDLEAMKGLALKREWLHYYPFDKISQSWPVYFGIDFASTEDKLKDKDRDYFALAIGQVIPGGGVILIGGFRDRVSTGEAIAKTKALANMYHPIMIGVEKWGKGEEFKQQLLYSTSLPILGLPLKGAPVKSKGERFQTGLGNIFMTSRAWVSDADDEFIRAFYDEWIGWDGGKSRTGHDDTLDAVYWMCFTAAAHLMPAQEEAPENLNKPKVPKKNIWSNAGGIHA